MRVCVLIPTYNESRTIAELVAVVKTKGLDILVIDDGSTDNTGAIAQDNGASVIIHKKNKGKGASLKVGFKYALENRYEAVVVMDGDGQHNPEDIKRFVQAAETTDADLIIGNRMWDTKSMPFIRRLTNKWMSNFISKISGQHIPDTQCGYRLIKSELLRNTKLISSKYETESEILIRAGRDGFKTLSIPIKTIYKGEVSTIHPIKDALRFIRLILNITREKKGVKS